MNKMSSQHSGECIESAIYLAFGMPYLAMTLVSAETFRRFNPDRGIVVISNIPPSFVNELEFWDAARDQWIEINDVDSNNRKYKTSVANLVNVDRAAFIDCDTLITGSLDGAFSYLDYFDIALRAHRGCQTHKHLAQVKLLDNGMTVRELPHWNGGVVFYKNSASIREMFHQWVQNFEILGQKFDQPALAKTLIEGDLRILSLDERWNGGFREIRDDWGGIPRIVHYHSALDQCIERRMKYFADIISNETSSEVGKIIDQYILQCARKQRSKSLLKFALRRLYRKRWHNVYKVVACS